MISRFRKLRHTLALLPVLLLSISCSAPQPPLRVGLLEWPPYEIVRLAALEGYFGDLEVEFVEFQSPAEAARAYAVGGLDIVALTLDYTIDLANRDDDHRVFIVIDESLGGDAVISREPVTHLAELADKEIALESSELGAHMLSRLLDQAGLSADDIGINFVDIPDHVRLWQQSDIDAIITYEPARTRLLELGGHQVFSSADIPGEIVDVFLARESALQADAWRFRQFTDGWFAALRHWQQDPAGCAAVLSPRLGMTPQEFAAAIAGVRLISLAENHRLLNDEKAQFLESINRFVSSVALTGTRVLPDNLPDVFTTVALPPLTEGQP